MAHYYYLNEDHSYIPCDLMTWANQFEKIDRKICDNIVDGHHVSTIWLGLDHNHLRDIYSSKPLLFETMVFDSSESDSDIYMDRYTTWEEAVEGHKKAVEWVKNRRNNEPTEEMLAFMDLKGKIVKLMFEFTEKYASPTSNMYPQCGHILIDVLKQCLYEAELQIDA